jgi:hypothetical protein
METMISLRVGSKIWKGLAERLESPSTLAKVVSWWAIISIRETGTSNFLAAQ